jgi:dCMP deaminase
VADRFGRPNWDDYFMAMTMLTTTRSIDDRTKHGCVITDDRHRVLTMGYNGPLRGALDDNVPTTAPDKYPWMEHSERNAVYNSKVSLEGAIAYISGHPCVECFRALVQTGVKRIVFGPIKSSSHFEDENAIKIIREMLIGQDIKFEEYKGNFWEVFDIMENYLETKDIRNGKD